MDISLFRANKSYIDGELMKRTWRSERLKHGVVFKSPEMIKIGGREDGSNVIIKDG